VRGSRSAIALHAAIVAATAGELVPKPSSPEAELRVELDAELRAAVRRRSLVVSTI
jgi:hypothetical protein